MGGRGKNPKKKQRKTVLYTCMLKKKSIGEKLNKLKNMTWCPK